MRTEPAGAPAELPEMVRARKEGKFDDVINGKISYDQLQYGGGDGGSSGGGGGGDAGGGDTAGGGGGGGGRVVRLALLGCGKIAEHHVRALALVCQQAAAGQGGVSVSVSALVDPNPARREALMEAIARAWAMSGMGRGKCLVSETARARRVRTGRVVLT